MRGLDLEVAQGELVAFLGPNGAGKSTTLRMLTTLLAADVRHRRGRRLRRRPRAAAACALIGYVGQGNGAGHQQRGRDELVSQARAYGLTRREARRAGRRAARGLRPDRARRPAGLARSRAASAAGSTSRSAWCTRRALLFLDEPSTGLDPQNRANLQEQVQRLHRELGTTIVLTTHYLEEADALADRVIVIDHGLVIADDTRAAAQVGARRPGARSASAGRRRDAAAADRAAPARRARSSTVDGTGVAVRVAHGRDLAAPAWSPTSPAAGPPVAAIEVVGPDARRRLPRPHRPQPAREQRDATPTPTPTTSRRSSSMTTLTGTPRSARRTARPVVPPRSRPPASWPTPGTSWSAS